MKYLPGPLISIGSGSLGGQTFSHNRYGLYVRSKVIPTNPNTALQQAVRNIFQSLAWLWTNTVTQTQRDAWNLYATNVTVKDALGEDIHLSGFNHYLRSNCPILRAPLARVDAGPTTFTLAETDPTIVATLSEATQQISLTFDDTMDYLDEDNAFMQVAMSIPQAPGREFLLPRFRVAGFVLGDAITPLTSPQTFSTPWAITEDQKVMVQCRIGRADGRLSPTFRDTAKVAS